MRVSAATLVGMVQADPPTAWPVWLVAALVSALGVVGGGAVAVRRRRVPPGGTPSRRPHGLDTVYALRHEFRRTKRTSVTLFGVYASRDEAAAAMRRLRTRPGFDTHPDGFVIERVWVDRVPDGAEPDSLYLIRDRPAGGGRGAILGAHRSPIAAWSRADELRPRHAGIRIDHIDLGRDLWTRGYVA